MQTIFELTDRPANALTVEVIGHQWWFEYVYPDQGITTANTLVIPAGMPVELQLTSEDVLHNFWVPALVYTFAPDTAIAQFASLGLGPRELIQRFQSINSQAPVFLAAADKIRMSRDE